MTPSLQLFADLVGYDLVMASFMFILSIFHFDTGYTIHHCMVVIRKPMEKQAKATQRRDAL